MTYARSLFTALILLAPVARAQEYTFLHFAGSTGGGAFRDDIGSRARFDQPAGLIVVNGAIYIADVYNRVIRKYKIATGEVTTLAGLPRVSGSADGIRAHARFAYPYAVASDGTSLYVADTYNHAIRRVTLATGTVETLAGRPGLAGSSDGVGRAARFNGPRGVVADSRFVYVADTDNHAIRRINIATREVVTLAGNPNVIGAADGAGSDATFQDPQGIVLTGGALFIVDTSNQIVRKLVLATGAVTTIAGQAGEAGGNDGVGPDARFTFPVAMTTDGQILYLTDTLDHTIRAIEISTGHVVTLAGQYAAQGSNDGFGMDAHFRYPEGITWDNGTLYIMDTNNHVLRRMNVISRGVVTLAGFAAVEGATDGSGTEAQFNYPVAVTTDGAFLYVADAFNHTIRKIDLASRAVSTLAGLPGLPGHTDGLGGMASFRDPEGLVTVGRTLFIADAGNHAIRRLNLNSGVVTTFVGAEGGIGYPAGIATDGQNLYVADAAANTILRIDIATASVTTLAGVAGLPGSADGRGAAARFNSPRGVAWAGDRLYVADLLNQTIRSVDPTTSEVNTIAGIPHIEGAADGIGADATFTAPYGLAVSNGTLWIIESSSILRKLDLPTRRVTSMAGTANVVGATDGTGLDAQFNMPYGIAVNGQHLYIADAANFAIREGVPAIAAHIAADSTKRFLSVSDNDATTLQWSILTRPEGSRAALSSSSGTQTAIGPDLFGLYRIRLDAIGPAGERIETIDLNFDPRHRAVTP